MGALSFCSQLKNLLARLTGFETEFMEFTALLRGGVVVLRQDGRDARYFRPSANTNAARKTALKAAMEAAAGNLSTPAQVTLLYGQFAVDAGEPITAYAPANATIEFGPGSSVLYADENDAASDPRMYPGQERWAKNFGATTDAADNQPMFQAALFSMPSRGEPVYQPAKYPTLVTRTGVMHLEAATYSILDSIWITSYQCIVGATGRESVIGLPDGFAPASGGEKFAIETACFKPGGGGGDPELQTGANFTFSIRIINIQLANQGFSNAKASGLRYGCAQGGEIRIVTSAMGGRGIVLLGNTCHITVHHWGVAYAGVDNAIVQTGPHLSGYACWNCRFSMISEEHINNRPVADHADYTYAPLGITAPLACVMFFNSRDLRFESCAGESNGNYMYFKSCHGTKIGNIDHMAAQVIGRGGCVVKFDGCINSGFESILCRYFENAYVAIGLGASSLGDAASTFFPAGPFNTTGDTFITLSGAPTTSHVPANGSRDIRNSTTGKVRRWANNNGALEYLEYIPLP